MRSINVIKFQIPENNFLFAKQFIRQLTLAPSPAKVQVKRKFCDEHKINNLGQKII